MATVEDLAVEREIEALSENAQQSWHGRSNGLVRVASALLYALETMTCTNLRWSAAGIPCSQPRFTGGTRRPVSWMHCADAPEPYNVGNNFFFPTGQICAPWNRLASTERGPHPKWMQSNWRQQAQTKGTVTLAAMVSRLHHELRSQRYRGRKKC